MKFPNDLIFIKSIKGTTSFCEQGATIVNRQELDANNLLIRSCWEPEVGMPCSDELTPPHCFSCRGSTGSSGL